jgi:hypothetical protein
MSNLLAGSEGTPYGWGIMNRIYQGRVTRVQRMKAAEGNGPRKTGKGANVEWEDLDDGEAMLWRHHELFQDAVNYYTVALAALADGMRDDKGEQLTPMGAFGAQVKERWEGFTHKGKKREGLHQSLSRTLGIKEEEATWETCMVRILSASLKHFPDRKLSEKDSRDVFHGVIAEMFPAKSRGLNPQKMARSDWPWLCWKNASGETPAKAYYRKNNGINDFMSEFFGASESKLRELAKREVADTYLSSVVQADDEEYQSTDAAGAADSLEGSNECEAAEGVEQFTGVEAIAKWKVCVATAKKMVADPAVKNDFMLLGGNQDCLMNEIESIEASITAKEVECIENPDALHFQKWKTGGEGKDNARVELFVLVHLSQALPQITKLLQARLKPVHLAHLVKTDPVGYLEFVDKYDLCGEEVEKGAPKNGKEPFEKVKKAREKAANAAKKQAKASTAERLPLTGASEVSRRDCIQTIRDKCGVVFPGFTAIKEFVSSPPQSDNDMKWQPWAAGTTEWKEFEFAALEEALKSPNQIKQKTEERQKERSQLEAIEKAYKGGGRAKSTDDDGGDDDHVPGFRGDERFVRIEALHKTLAVADGVSEAETHKYGFSQAALRGYEELRDEWNKLVKPNEPFSEENKAELKEKVLKEHQREHRDDVGAVLLFEKLLEKDNWCLWQAPTVDQEQERKEKNHSGNIVRDYMRYLEVKERIEELKKPVQYTPANAALSRRLYDLKGGAQGGFKHGVNKDGLWFETQIAAEIKQGGKSFFERLEVRVCYTAPRLLRDGSRALSETENLKAANWLQPMTKALGIQSDLKHDFSKHAVSLMPDWNAGSDSSQPDRLLLNFVLRIKEDGLVAELRKLMQRKAWPWTMQFNWNGDGHDSTLRWPHENWSKVEGKKGFPGQWHASADLTQFRFLSVDLGQKQAGAYAIIEVSCTLSEAEKGKCRFIGATGSGEAKRCWYARVEKTGLLKLQGEDAKVYRPEYKNGKPVIGSESFREELSGSAGRGATSGESQQVLDLLGKMKQLELLNDLRDPPSGQEAGSKEVTIPVGLVQEAFTFPEQNSKLLVALRRAQSFAAKLHRWCWYLNPKEERKDQAERRRIAIKEIAEADAHDWLPPEAQAWAKTEHDRIKDKPAEKAAADSRLAGKLQESLKALLPLLPDWLETIANRVYHARSGRFVWGEHPEKTDCHILSFKEWTDDERNKVSKDDRMIAGHRGLAIERIEQMEELRKRCQSLNQMLRRDIGDVPPRGRDDTIPDPCPAVLAKLDNIKEQRRNQTAHLIVAEALGLGLAEPRVQIRETEAKLLAARKDNTDPEMIEALKAKVAALRREIAFKDAHGEYTKVDAKGHPVLSDKVGDWRGIVDFVVIEDLSRYRTTQGRAPRENSRLMKWCHRAIRDKLKEMCEPFGIPLIETPAAYSSRFCSNTGVAGFRATELTAATIKQAKWRWRIRKREDGKEETKEQKARREQWEALYAEVKRINETRDGTVGKEFRTLLVPDAGGSIFIPIANLDASYVQPPKDPANRKNPRPIIQYLAVSLEEAQSQRPKLIHADINAAVNLALRAVGDPRLWSIHSRLRSEREVDEVKGIQKANKPGSAEAKKENSVERKPDKFFAREKRKHGILQGEKRVQIVSTTELKASDSRHPNFFEDVANLRGTHWGLARLQGLEASERVPKHLVSGKALWGFVKDQSWKRCCVINAARLRSWAIEPPLAWQEAEEQERGV